MLDAHTIDVDGKQYSTERILIATGGWPFIPDIDIYKTRFTPMKSALSGLDEKTLMKMIVVCSTDRVVGLHMVGSEVPEIIQGMAVAIRAGATKAVFDSTIRIHRTSAEEFVTLRNVVT